MGRSKVAKAGTDKNVTQQGQLLDGLKSLYTDDRYGHLNLWPVTRDWIKREMGNRWNPEWEVL